MHCPTDRSAAAVMARWTQGSRGRCKARSRASYKHMQQLEQHAGPAVRRASAWTWGFVHWPAVSNDHAVCNAACGHLSAVRVCISTFSEAARAEQDPCTVPASRQDRRQRRATTKGSRAELRHSSARREAGVLSSSLDLRCHLPLETVHSSALVQADSSRVKRWPMGCACLRPSCCRLNPSVQHSFAGHPLWGLVCLQHLLQHVRLPLSGALLRTQLLTITLLQIQQTGPEGLPLPLHMHQSAGELHALCCPDR